MPTLHWIGKDKVINHHQDVPFKILEKQYTYSNGTETLDGVSENKIIHGDNLEALKSLLPEYEGKVKCIYIDPPYNTGNEGWVYNDNSNDPKIKKWLGQVVGKESEDLTRHDKWLCMMYPRLKLLHKLLADDGAIFISIDDNEQANLRLVCDEIFGNRNFKGNIARATGTPTGQGNDRLANEIDYILVFSKTNLFQFKGLPFSEKDEKIYNLYDENGKYLLRTLRKTGGEDKKEDRPNMFYGIISPNNNVVFPKGPNGYDSRWRVAENTFHELVAENRIEWKKNSEGELSPYMKFYLEGRTKQASNLWNNIEGNKKAQIDIKNIFTEKIFETPKPIELIQRAINLSTDQNSIILDSFAGSGTTAHAVLNLNKQDGGNRKFILIEMEDYAENITAERVKRVINGYGEGNKSVEGTGGDFTYYELGKPIFLENELLNEEVDRDKIEEYVWYSETKTPYIKQGENYLLGKKDHTAYYFYYEKEKITTLDESFLRTIKTKGSQYIIYADNCLLNKELMQKYNIIFKKIPRDITRF
ncbi:site-specific DNA-methyltransferase [Chryseobacterium sp. 5_R23647]|uniref:site-specific DNA-methyltransferase n=1 Tax=Chryseobacterium sp. 5_R23647 TaxID=2258964 RepID=UPI000E257A11|nr:site-specific DNA-methyltransferase [Chryseobacterium sp. 5_R23647]REC45881.1 site-specific DNA-methyltransferase [Chryseobacterium sp. 5_R23647]